MTAPHAQCQPGSSYDARTDIEARLAELYTTQAAATGWGAAVGARHEEIKSLEGRLAAMNQPQPVSREAIARIIDPNFPFWDFAVPNSFQQKRKNRALAKADAILALSAPKASVEPADGAREVLARSIEEAWAYEPVPFNRADVAVRVILAALRSPAVDAQQCGVLTEQEPVAWWAYCEKTGGQMVRTPGLKDMLIEEADRIYAEHGYVLRPLYAAAPSLSSADGASK